MTGGKGRVGRWLAAAAAAVVLAGCPADPAQRGPVGADDGLFLTGHLGGHAVNVTSGEPEVLYGDCDPGDGRDVDLCIAGSTIHGESFGIVIENPAALAAGAVLPVDGRCPPNDCGERAALFVRRSGESIRANGGQVTVTRADDRFAARLLLRFGNDTLVGGFNVKPPSTP